MAHCWLGSVPECGPGDLLMRSGAGVSLSGVEVEVSWFINSSSRLAMAADAGREGAVP